MAVRYSSATTRPQTGFVKCLWTATMPSRVPRELSREVMGCNAFNSSAITFFGSVAHQCRSHMQVHCHCKQMVSKEDGLKRPKKMGTGLSNVGNEHLKITQ